MNEKKICFIICANDSFLVKECRLYIENLQVPEGFSIEIEEVWGAASMAAGYNEGMKRSDARYKVYLHQDVLIIRPEFIRKIVELFQTHPQTGMLGMVGNTRITKDITPWGKGTVRIGTVYADLVEQPVCAVLGNAERDLQNVIFVDGLLMVTQYDIPWREDLFKGWDMYDLSQSMEFWRAGYAVAVPRMDTPWVFHDNDLLNLQNYEKWKAVFMREYQKDYKHWNGRMIEQKEKSTRVIYQIFTETENQPSFPYPPIYEDDADYILFTDRKKLSSGYWNIVFLENVDSDDAKRTIEELLSGYQERYELKSNQIQTGSLLKKIEKPYMPFITLPTYEELGFLGFDGSKVISVKDENANYAYEKNPVYTGGKYEGREYLLTIGMPVSNQIETIDRCLSHVKPLLDKLDAELVIANTGSTDGTIEVCRSYGARVIDFPWCNDMSAARNAVVRSAKGLWLLSMDDDEWFENTDEIYEFFRSGKYKSFDMASYVQRNYMEQGTGSYMDHNTSRMVKIREDTHFEGRIHDTIVPGTSGGVRVCNLHSYAHHYGFARDNMERVVEKSKRNLLGLIYDLYEFPEDLRYNYQFANEFQVVGDYRSAALFFFRGVSMGKELKAYQKYHALNLMYCLVHEKGDALYDIYELLKDYCDYTAAEKAFLYYGMAEKAQELKKKPEEILSYCEKVEDYIEEYKQNEEENWAETVKGLHICTDETNITAIRILALQAYCKLGDIEHAVDQINKISLEYICDNQAAYTAAFFEADRVIFDYALSRMSGFVCSQWAEVLLAQVIRSSTEGNLQSQELSYRIRRLFGRISIPVLEVRIRGIENREILIKSMGEDIKHMNLQEKWLRMVLLREKVLGEKKKQEPGILTGVADIEIFLQYCESVWRFANAYYNPEILQMEENSPIALEQRAAYHVALAFFIENCSMTERISYLKKAVEVFPGFKSKIAEILRQMQRR